MQPFNAALIGIGGHGKTHVSRITSLVSDGLLNCVAFAEPNVAANIESYDTLTAIGAKHYTDYKEMLRCQPEIDFVVISTPIPLHKPMSIYAMEQGVHVLTEKPPAVTIQDVEAMSETAKRTGKRCAVLFQNTSGQAFRLMLQKLKEGAIGKVLTVTGVGMWHRTDEYYARTPWAGQLLYKGEYVLDGTVNNALAHLLNNCLIAAGSGDPGQARPKWVQAELYRGHHIEAEDTSCIRLETSNGVKVLYYATLCHVRQETPYIVVEGSSGSMRWSYDNTLTVADHTGQLHQYRFEQEDLMRNMYLNFMDALRQGDGAEVYSSIDDCKSFMLASNGAYESSRQTYPLPADEWANLADLFKKASESGKLFSELGVEWAVATKPFDLTGYKQFALYK